MVIITVYITFMFGFVLPTTITLRSIQDKTGCDVLACKSRHDHPETELNSALQKSDECAAETCRGDRVQRLRLSYESNFLSGKQKRQLDTLRSICFSLNVQKGQITVADENIHLEAEMFPLCPAELM